jgi:hypothetical protein
VNMVIGGIYPEWNSRTTGNSSYVQALIERTDTGRLGPNGQPLMRFNPVPPTVAPFVQQSQTPQYNHTGPQNVYNQINLSDIQKDQHRTTQTYTGNVELGFISDSDLDKDIDEISKTLQASSLQVETRAKRQRLDNEIDPIEEEVIQKAKETGTRDEGSVTNRKPKQRKMAVPKKPKLAKPSTTPIADPVSATAATTPPEPASEPRCTTKEAYTVSLLRR